MAKVEWVFGIHAVQALLKSAPQRIQLIQLVQGRQDQRMQKLLAAANNHNINLEYVERKQLDQSCAGKHQGVLARVVPGQQRDEQFLFELLDNLTGEPLVLVLDGVTDPHNLGACLRSADAAGVHAVVIPKDNSAGLNEAARKVASGAAETVPLIPVTNLARTLDKLKAKGLWLAGTDGDAQQTLYQADLSGPRVLVMGAEGSGMRRLTREKCDMLIKIPMCGSVSSLNVSVATGVVLFEVLRQRGL
ncbi:MAG: 23S rRNA (guanosine(2251)-2'-O)-methyltransferase RlmB [Cellvibrionaceae bacterium]|nr:23S rRNA (guanosine(2251)-2'-O)-methyltransferase RlmB [Cellvibrionaceae bacterium]